MPSYTYQDVLRAREQIISLSQSLAWLATVLEAVDANRWSPLTEEGIETAVMQVNEIQASVGTITYEVQSLANLLCDGEIPF